MSGRIGIVLVDDHPMFRRGLRGLLDSVADTEVLGEAGTGEDAVRLATVHRPDVVLMDLNLPGMSGAEATQRVLRASPATAVLVVTMVEDDDAIITALDAGARGYVLKGAGQEELLAAVRAVHHGSAVFGRSLAPRLLARLGQVREAAPTSAPGLSDRENEVLRLMAEGLDNAGIARRLGVSVKTVQNHVSHLLTKLDARNRVDAVLRFRGGA
ncbi:DNA-binding response regulator, NarL/FixJ family, contains REC and HTH domains [Blastococcus sp. DSM 46786]|uniref:response regulator n=1 Tax=Blastococcus sp. DSM 46786 TaxID=1798227 RepID=UPI0008CCEB50|nr:response regulator transcription factor [Blastococcus sp. DSM 46786]SEK56998.1 DNA-binding response regulator, NarL/FixJ family, contains REC and HTH domains [Blastococcus sp. DSM 46786]